MRKLILSLVFVIALSSTYVPATSAEIQGAAGQSTARIDVIHTLKLLYPHDCITVNTFSPNDQTPVLERDEAGSDQYSSGYSYGSSFDSVSSINRLFYYSMLLSIGSIICILFFFHIFFIHLRDGKK